MATIGKRAYAEMFGPTVGDRVRLQGGDLAGEMEGTVSSLGLLHTVLFAPEDLALVKGDWVNDRQHVKLPLTKYVTREGERRVAVDPDDGQHSHTVFNLQARLRAAAGAQKRRRARARGRGRRAGPDLPAGHRGNARVHRRTGLLAAAGAHFG